MTELKVVADAANEDEWLYRRRGYITASDIFKLLTHDELCTFGWYKEKWMDDTPDDVFHRKVTDEKPDFKNPVAVLWGQKEEDHNRELFSLYSGVPTWGSHTLLACDRWKYIATTLDGYCFIPPVWEDLEHPEMFEDADQVRTAIRNMPVGQASLLEMKQTSEFGVKSWLKGKSKMNSTVTLGEFVPSGPGMPVYYLPQVQTQMAIAGLDHNLAVVKGGASTLTAHAYALDPRWLDVLDSIDERFGPRIEEVRNQI